MKSIFNRADNREIIHRIEKLTPTTQATWGKMTVAQMLAHCQQPLKVSLGDTKGKQSLIGKLFGGFAKKQLMGEKPMKRNLTTDKTFAVRETRDFNEEKQKLIRLIERFEAGPAVLSKDPHPFFGKLTEEESDRIIWKHLDHHLQQFGV